MSLRGAFAEPDRTVRLASEPGLYLDIADPSRMDAQAVYQLLIGPSRDLPTGVHIAPHELWAGLGQWLALREPDACALSAEDQWAERGLVPCLIEIWGQCKICLTSGLLGEGSLSVLARSPGPTHLPDEAAFELIVRTFGPDDALARRLIKQVRLWDTLGRPGTQGMRIRVYPIPADYASRENEIVVTKRWTRLVLDWPSPLL